VKAERRGVCQNGGCERLATVVVVIYGLGNRQLCYHCEQALSAYQLLQVLRPVERRQPVDAA
jgi:hypothetical protein